MKILMNAKGVIFTFLMGLCSQVFACSEALQNYPEDCKIQDDYQTLKSYFADNYNIDIENLTGYKALRFIKDKHWHARKNDFSCQPWEFYAPKPKTWLYWERGNALVKDISREIKEGRLNFDRELISKVHLGSVDKSLIGTLAKLKGATPGKTRKHFWQFPPGFTVDCDEKEIDEEAYKFMKNYDLKDEDGDPLIEISLAKCELLSGFVGASSTKKKKSYYGGVVKYLGSSNVQEQLEKLLVYANESVQKIQSGQSDISPIELMADIQRWYVSIHPFGDGNGRTSRYLQDLMSRHFDLPFFRAGNLQHDVFVNKEQYRQDSRNEMRSLVADLKMCKSFYDQGKGYDEMPCDCRPLYMKGNKINGVKTKKIQKIKQNDGNYKCVENPTPAPVQEVEEFHGLILWMINNGIYEDRDL